MTILIVLAVLVAGAASRPAIKRSWKRRRLLLEAAEAGREAERARARDRERDAAALLAAQPAYFADYGIRTVDRRSTPRVADTGTLHLDHDLADRYETETSVEFRKPSCRYGCGQFIVALHEIAPGSGAGVWWEDIGRYCASCGAWSYPGSSEEHFRPKGPLGLRLKGASNLFDALGPPKSESDGRAWERVEAEIAELEARLNAARARRLALAEKLGKPLGAPFRPQLVSGGKAS